MNGIEIITLNKSNISDYATERNLLLKKAKSKWVLFLDTDEVLSLELKKEIQNLNPKNFNGFYIKRKIVFLGNEIGEDKVLRLAKKSAGIWKRKVHEIWVVKGMIKTLRNYIVHNTAENLSSYIDKINNYSSLHARENKKEGKKTSILKIIFYPGFKFFQNFLRGRGFVFSMLQAFHSFLAWVKLWELRRK